MSQHTKDVNRYLSCIKNGDMSRETVKALFDLTSNHLKIVAEIYLYNKSYADDVLVDAFKKAFRYIDSFDEEQDGYNWLCKIVQNIAYSYNEKNSAFDSCIPIENIQIPLNTMEQIDEKIDLSDALNSLDIESKTVIIMYFYLRYTYEEIGQELGKGKVSVYRQLKRILKKLKKIL